MLCARTRDDDRDLSTSQWERFDAKNPHYTNPLGSPDAAVVLDERIAMSDLDSDHFAAALVQRIGWALADADDAEHRRRA